MIWCMLDKNRAQNKEGYTINRIGPTCDGYSYMVIRPSESLVVWVGAEHRDARKMAIRACLEDIAAQTNEGEIEL